MRILLDECVPGRLRRSLPGHQVFTVAEKGWKGKRNGSLLTLMIADQVDLMITVDRRIKFQQNLAAHRVSLIVLLANSNRLADLLPFADQLQSTRGTIQPGDYVELARQP
jgi:hypothetical protein